MFLPPIGEPPEEFRNVDLQELRRFYRNPTAYFFKQRLGLRLDEDKESAEGREPFAIHAPRRLRLGARAGGLENWPVKNLADAYPAARSRGVLPAGAAGELVFQDAVASVEAFTGSLLPLIQGEPLAPVDFDFRTAGFRRDGTNRPDLAPASLALSVCGRQSERPAGSLD